MPLFNKRSSRTTAIVASCLSKLWSWAAGLALFFRSSSRTRTSEDGIHRALDVVQCRPQRLLTFIVYPRNVTPETRPGPRVDLIRDQGGLNGAGVTGGQITVGLQYGFPVGNPGPGMVVRELDPHSRAALCECDVVVEATYFSVSPDYDCLLHIKRADKNEEIEVV
jgi:hypothetical protein